MSSIFHREIDLLENSIIDRSTSKVRDLTKSDDIPVVDRIACNSSHRISIQVKVEENNNNTNNFTNLSNNCKLSSKSTCNESSSSSSLSCNWCPSNGANLVDDQSLANMCVYRCHLTNDGRILCNSNDYNSETCKNSKSVESKTDVYTKSQHDSNFNHFRPVNNDRYYQQSNLANRLPQNYHNFDLTTFTEQEPFLASNKIGQRSIANLGYSVDALSSSSINSNQVRNSNSAEHSTSTCGSDKSFYSKSKSINCFHFCF